MVAGPVLLDVGCSNGQFMYHASHAGFQVQGVELNPGTARIAKANGLTVSVGTLAEAQFAAGSFDVITLNDVIEHVPNPRSLLGECRRLLQPKGILVIGTPNLDCLFNKLTWCAHRLLGIPWSAVTPPHHVFQFSRRSLTPLLREMGFDLKKLVAVPTSDLLYELNETEAWVAFRRGSSVQAGIRLAVACSWYAAAYGVSRLMTLRSRDDTGLIGFWRRSREQ
jgi:2-polyprenyl-3-methyl-5-hydroxy-6-metoxy-1,4-benzoquinol methylase